MSPLAPRVIGDLAVELVRAHGEPMRVIAVVNALEGRGIDRRSAHAAIWTASRDGRLDDFELDGRATLAIPDSA